MDQCKILIKTIVYSFKHHTDSTDHSLHFALPLLCCWRRVSMKKNNSSTLPHELIEEILLRLPVRSLLRFKCVCKSWLSLISDPQFAISHFDLAASPSHRLLLRENGEGFIESRDIDASLYDHDSAVVNLLILPDYGFLYDEYGILGSCRGIILLYYESGDIVLWNPSTGAHKPIPERNFGVIFSSLFGFGYDASTDDYLVVLVDLNGPEIDEYDSPTRVMIFSFKTNSWNYISYKDVQYEELWDDCKSGSHLNGAIHWLVFSEDEFVIIAFDWIEKSFTEILVPDDLSEESKYEVHSLRIMNGCLSLCCLPPDGSLVTEIWVMKEYKVLSSWTKFVVITSTYDFSLICITKDGGILGSNFCGIAARLEKHNDEGELLERITYVHDRDRESPSFNLQSAMYSESLLSPPGDFMKTSIDDERRRI